MNEVSRGVAWINFWKPKDDWYYLSHDEREKLLSRWNNIRTAAVIRGANSLGTFACRANTDWARVSLWTFPDLTVLTELHDELSDARYYQYFAEANSFGLHVANPYDTFMAAADATIEMQG